MRNRRTTIRFPIYSGYEVRVISASDVRRTGLRLGVDLAGCAAALVIAPDEPSRAWLVLGPDADEDTIAHEASHVVRAMFAHVGARTDNENFAYHLGFLVGRIHRFLKKAK